MKRAYLADSLVDAQLVVDWLTGCGIPCALFNENVGGALGELPVSGPEVWVRRDGDLDRALATINTKIFNDVDGERSCPDCHEINPTGFDICWQCQQPLA